MECGNGSLPVWYYHFELFGGVCVGVHHCGWCSSVSFLGEGSDFHPNWFCAKIILLGFVP